MERLSITHGMPVVDAAGHRLGIVEVCGAEHLLLRRGFVHPRHFAARYLDVTSLEGGEVHLDAGERALLAPDRPDLQAGVRQGVLPFQRSLWGGAPAS
jgi:hypothetical protein